MLSFGLCSSSRSLRPFSYSLWASGGAAKSAADTIGSRLIGPAGTPFAPGAGFSVKTTYAWGNVSRSTSCVASRYPGELTVTVKRAFASESTWNWPVASVWHLRTHAAQFVFDLNRSPLSERRPVRVSHLPPKARRCGPGPRRAVRPGLLRRSDRATGSQQQASGQKDGRAIADIHDRTSLQRKLSSVLGPEVKKTGRVVAHSPRIESCRKLEPTRTQTSLIRRAENG